MTRQFFPLAAMRHMTWRRELWSGFGRSSSSLINCRHYYLHHSVLNRPPQPTLLTVNNKTIIRWISSSTTTSTSPLPTGTSTSSIMCPVQRQQDDDNEDNNSIFFNSNSSSLLGGGVGDKNTTATPVLKHPLIDIATSPPPYSNVVGRLYYSTSKRSSSSSATNNHNDNEMDNKDKKSYGQQQQQQPDAGNGGASTTTSLETNWNRIKNRLLDKTILPVGSMEPVHWAEAEGLFKSLHQLLPSSSSSNSSIRQQRIMMIVHDSFAILDRLDEEAQVHRLLVPCDVRMLGSVVGAWRQAVRGASAQGAQEYGDNNNVNDNHDDAPPLSLMLTPRQVVTKLQNYTATGLFEPNKRIYTSIIHAIDTTNNNNNNLLDASTFAEQIVGGMRARAKYNPYDITHHPNRDTINNLIQRYAEAAIVVIAPNNNNDEVIMIPPIKACEYLKLLQSWYNMTRRPDMKPDTRTYAAVIAAWGNYAARFHHNHHQHHHSAGGASSHGNNNCMSVLSRIQALWNEMNREYPLVVNRSIDKDNSSNTNGKYGSVEDDEEFTQFEEKNDDDEVDSSHEEQQQDGRSLPAYNGILHALAQTRQPGAGQMAHEILNQLLQNYQQNPNTSTLKPNPKTFSAVISAYGRTGHADEAEAVFQVMEDLYYKTTDVSFRPDNACFGALIWAFAKVGDAKRAEAVLIRMANMVSTGGSDLELDADCWNGVLVAWAQSGHEDATERTATVIQWLQEMSKNRNNDGKQINDDFLTIKTYNTLLGCFARSPNPKQGARLAQDLLEWMEEEHEKTDDTSQGQGLRPDGNTYLACITAWRNAKNPALAQAVLDKFCDRLLSQRQQRDGKHDDVETITSMIDRRHFHIAMAAWAESLDPQRGRKASDLLDRMIHDFAINPDVVTFNTLIHAWTPRSLENPKNATSKAEAILKSMKEQYRMGNMAALPDQTTYNSIIATLSWSTTESAPDRAMELFREMLDMDLAPDRKTYNTLMALFSRHGRPDKVQELFQEMVNGWKAGDESLKPHFKAYTTLLQAWSKAGEPEETAKVLKEMITKCESRELNGRPTSRDFDTVLQAWMRSKRPDAPGHAARGLAQMELLAKSGRFECWPTIYSYSAVISTYVRSRQSNAGEGAMNIFRRLKELYQRTRDISLRPTANDYAQVMIALSFASSSEASRQIEKLLMEISNEDESFWSESNVGSTYDKVTREIVNSKLPEKDMLLSSLTRLLDHRGLTPNRTKRRMDGGR